MMDTGKWQLRPDAIISADLGRLKQDRRVLALLARAGIQSYEEALSFLDPSFYVPTSAYELPDMEIALIRILQAVDAKEPILVWGDFDVDGITSTALLIEVLRAIGGDVQYTIPLRAEEGHGVHIPRAMKWIEQGIRLVITVDTGISAHAAIDVFRNSGVMVIVTDHHQLPETLPNALANVNPQRLSKDHPLHLLSGAGVAYKLAEAICGRTKRLELLPAALELAAIGLIADVVPLLRENRYLVQVGLENLRKTARQGIKALSHVAKLAPDLLDEEDIAFQLAPRLNALGRLADASDGVELLITRDAAQAAILANQVDALNVKRRAMTQQVVKGAEAILAARADIADSSVLVIAHEAWPAGVLGLAASQLAEKYQKPTLIIKSQPNGIAKGSARSVEGININLLLNSHSHLLNQWGGHDMAAGFTLQTGLIEDLRLALSRAVRMQGVPTKGNILEVDMLLPVGEGELGAELLRRLRPFGAGFPKPLFLAPRVTILKEGAIGREGQHLKIVVQDDELARPQSVLMWNTEQPDRIGQKVDLAYRLRVRDDGFEYLGEQLFEREDSPMSESVSYRPLIQDWRGLSQGEIEERLLHLSTDGILVEVWREGQSLGEGVRGLDMLSRADVLVVWHAPPNREWLKVAIERVKPREIAMVGRDCEFDEIGLFCTALIGAVKFAVAKREGKLDIDQLASRLGHTRKIVEIGLSYLVAVGRIGLIQDTGDNRVVLIEGEAQTSKEASEKYLALKRELAEIVAFRQFIKTADVTRLLG